MDHTLDYKNPPKYSTYKKRHIEKFGYVDMITESQFKEIASQNCYYCGVEGPNGIDRIDSSRGYVEGNCVPCCKHCNYAKGNLSIGDFEKWLKRLVGFQSKNPNAPKEEHQD